MKRRRTLDQLTEEQYTEYKKIGEEFSIVTQPKEWKAAYKKFCLKWFGE